MKKEYATDVTHFVLIKSICMNVNEAYWKMHSLFYDVAPCQEKYLLKSKRIYNHNVAKVPKSRIAKGHKTTTYHEDSLTTSKHIQQLKLLQRQHLQHQI